MKILLLEDNQDLLSDMKDYLEQEGNVCETAATYREAYSKIGIYPYDILIIDITLPDGSGLDIIREVKKENIEAGIIIVSAKDALDDKIFGLELGADDYLTKPFFLSELNARIKSLYRRKNFSGKKAIAFNEIVIVPDEGIVQVHNKTLALTKKEYDLLVYFIANKYRLLTKESIAEHLWGDHIETADSFNFIYTHLANIRKKIAQAGGSDYFRSVYGAGYKFTDKK